jgi:hypothetical protein
VRLALAVAEVTIAEVVVLGVEAVADNLAGTVVAVVADAEAMIKLILVTTLRRNGRSYPTKSAIRFARSVTRKESKEVRSVTYPNSQPNN